MSSAQQFHRIVDLVADLTRRERQGAESARLDDLAQHYDTTRAQIKADIRALTMLGDNPDADWVLSLRVTQESDRVSITSGGPFQRPIQFTVDELMAVQVGLADIDQTTGTLSPKLAGVMLAGQHGSLSLGAPVGPESVKSLLRQAINARRKVEVRYTGERSLVGINRIIHPYQLIEQRGHTYVVAWCELASGWRHFRLDRMLDTLVADVSYEAREDFVPANDSFREPAETTPVQVRFSKEVARWLLERHPEASPEPDGSLLLTYLVASPEWLIRHVLQYGPEAEVVAPESYRALMRRQLG
jgi:proteasome accessory factor C